MRWVGLFRNTKIKCLLVKNQPVGAIGGEIISTVKLQ